jgi:hypothetical protein
MVLFSIGASISLPCCELTAMSPIMVITGTSSIMPAALGPKCLAISGNKAIIRPPRRNRASIKVRAPCGDAP